MSYIIYDYDFLVGVLESSKLIKEEHHGEKNIFFYSPSALLLSRLQRNKITQPTAHL